MDLELLEIPDKKIEQLKKKGFNNIESLASFYPRKYHDFRKSLTPEEIFKNKSEYIENTELVAVIGVISEIFDNPKCITIKIGEGENKINITWFNQRYLLSQLYKHDTYVFCGKLQYNAQYDNFSIVNPMFYTNNKAEFNQIIPVYSVVKGMSAEYLNLCIKKAASLIIADENKEYDYIEGPVLERLGIDTYKTFLRKVHAPADDLDMAAAERRKTVDGLFPFSMKMAEKKYNAIEHSPCVITSTEIKDKFIENLPFELTNGQSKSIELLAKQMMNGKRVDALIQGDVGCGKTIIAIALSVLMAENGYQAAIMCPTTVLAKQHYTEISERLAPYNISVGFLESGMKVKEKRAILSKIYSGEIQIVVGTHAVVAKDVAFHNLGMTVVDEEHRFGVEQRDALRAKASDGVHGISMSATPIPRSIAVSIYGESATILNIRTLPKGRKPVKTVLFADEIKTYKSMLKQIQEGRQCYVVCPLIEDSDSEAMASVESVETTRDKIKSFFADAPSIVIETLTGNMKPAIIAEKIKDFSDGKTHILISTTIIEVGVNVPNATVMMIKNAERFGLAQLHQLRGRVGRSDLQSYCVLLSNQQDNPRLNAMVETTNGFEIAQKDFELRGSGDILGTKQSGIDKCITLMLQNPDLYEAINLEVDDIYEGRARYERYVRGIEEEV